jgi:hypothetical protein
MSIKQRLVTNITIRITENYETIPLNLINLSLEIDYFPLNLINLSLEIGYCSMTLSNHDKIKLVRLVVKIKIGVRG